jgi:hypothetical protein
MSNSVKRSSSIIRRNRRCEEIRRTRGDTIDTRRQGRLTKTMEEMRMTLNEGGRDEDYVKRRRT